MRTAAPPTRWTSRTAHVFQQTSGIASFGWLASIVTMCIFLVYILTNAATPFFAHSRNELRVIPHLVVLAVSTLLLLLPIASYILPPLPGIGSFLTGLGFVPTAFPVNILPVFVLAWKAVGLLYARLGRIVRGKGESNEG